MTKSINEILPREMNSGIAELLSNFSDLIDEVVNYGTHILKWLIDEPRGGDDQMPLIMFFREILEKADSISILIRNSSVDPSKGILRSLFELNLFISYITENHFNDRSMAFLVWHTKNKIQINRTFQKGNQEFKNLQKQIENDNSYFDSETLQKLPSSKKILDNLNVLLKRPKYQKALKEFEKTKTKIKNPSWYSLFNGPRNIQQLAIYLKKSTLYEIVYRSWSGSVHNTDIINGKIVKSKNPDNNEDKVKADLIQLRLPKDAQTVSAYTLVLLIETFNVVIDSKIPDKRNEYKKWYLTIRENLFKVTNKEQLIKIEY